MAEFSVVRALPCDRPEPPDCLNERQAALWRSITATKPAEWFTDETLPLLRAYCEADETHREVSERIKTFDKSLLNDFQWMKAYALLTRIQTAQAGSLAALAVKMRLSQSARYDAQKAARRSNEVAALARKPWD